MIDCGPDLQTQLPVICYDRARPPKVRHYPVDPATAFVNVATKRGALRSAYEGSCLSVRRGYGLVARVHWCDDGSVRVELRRKRHAKRRQAEIVVGGGRP